MKRKKPPSAALPEGAPYILGRYRRKQQEIVETPQDSTNSLAWMVYAGNCQEALAICRHRRSAIMAMNSELVGLPRVLWMV